MPPDSRPEKGRAGGLCASSASAPRRPTQPCCSSLGRDISSRKGKTDGFPSTPGGHVKEGHPDQERPSKQRAPKAGQSLGLPGAPQQRCPKLPGKLTVVETTLAQYRWGNTLGEGPPQLCTAQHVTSLSTHRLFSEPQWPAVLGWARPMGKVSWAGQIRMLRTWDKGHVYLPERSGTKPRESSLAGKETCRL